jgi:hypothetical protein
MKNTYLHLDTFKAKIRYFISWKDVNLPYKHDFSENMHTFQHTLFTINSYLFTKNIHVCLGILLISDFIKICTPFIGPNSTENIAIFLKN